MVLGWGRYNCRHLLTWILRGKRVASACPFSTILREGKKRQRRNLSYIETSLILTVSPAYCLSSLIHISPSRAAASYPTSPEHNQLQLRLTKRKPPLLLATSTYKLGYQRQQPSIISGPLIPSFPIHESLLPPLPPFLSNVLKNADNTSRPASSCLPPSPPDVLPAPPLPATALPGPILPWAPIEEAEVEAGLL